MKLTSEDFIKNANIIHENKYDYSKTNYINSYTKVCIICPIHGEFWQTPSNHIHSQQGCPKCKYKRSSDTKTKNTEYFITKSIEKHGDKYDYSKVNYIGCYEKVCIICPIHGEFWQAPCRHIQGQGCPKCGRIKNDSYKYKTQEEFLKLAKSIHGETYDYSKVKYIKGGEKVCIICPIHGEFWQTPFNHTHHRCGCPKCKSSKLESQIRKFLKNNNIEFLEQVNCTTFKWLHKLRLDFYLPKYNICIECQGGQHFFPVKQFGGEEQFKKRQLLDKEKYELCKAHNIKILYYSNEKYKEYCQSIITDENELLRKIKSYV